MPITQRFTHRRGYVVAGLGIGQILSWGSTFYLLAVLSGPIIADTGWPSSLVIAGISLGLIIAGLGSPKVGSLVGNSHGRAVLITSALLLALGLTVLGFAPNQWWYLAAWAILGLGMSGGLYSGAFSVLGHTYGASARSAITLLTLFGGFASTICWPLSTLLVTEVGWRGTALVYAAAHLVITAPLYALTVPRSRQTATPTRAAASTAETPKLVEHQGSTQPLWPLIVMVALTSTLSTSVAGLMSIHIFTLLAGIGIIGAVAVALAATIGPSQVGARFIELVIGRKHHPLWTLVVSTLAVATSITLLGFGLAAPALLLVVYGMGIGLGSIANGTVPLALFGQDQYARIMGRIALPSLLAQAAAPLIGSFLIQSLGSKNTLVAVGLTGFVTFTLAIGLMLMYRHNRGLQIS